MRQIGSFPDEPQATRFTGFLTTQGISAHCETDGQRWIVWVRNEDQLPAARAALDAFVAEPEHPRYREAEREAMALRRQEVAKQQAARQNTVQMRDRWGTSRTSARRPLTMTIIVLCGILGVATDMGEMPPNSVMRALQFCDPSHLQDENWNGVTLAEKTIDIRQGQLWRVVTPAFLHGNPMHLLFNMVMFYQLATVLETRLGAGRLALLILIIALVSNLAQALAPNAWGGNWNFVGLSGVVYGLLGYAWMLSRYRPALGIYVPQTTLIFAVAFMVLGFVNLIPGIAMANWAHGAGFASGYVLGILPLMLSGTRVG
ncbi:MAG: rhomboid family intramembrane serine protease [Pirellulaceae bacterium]